MYLCPSICHLLTLFCRFRSHSLHNLFTHSTSYYSEFTSVFVTDSQYHECICHRLTVSRVYLFCNAILASYSLPRWLTNQVLRISVTTLSSLNPYPCQLFILWDFVHFLCCGILSCGILAVGILSCGILSCVILSGYHTHTSKYTEHARMQSSCIIKTASILASHAERRNMHGTLKYRVYNNNIDWMSLNYHLLCVCAGRTLSDHIVTHCLDH